jgi:hypothetical protein
MLTIKDLSASKELDSEAMAGVAGGEAVLIERRPAPFLLGDFQNSGNLFDVFNSTHYAPDYSVDVLSQSNLGAVSSSGNFGSVVIPQLAQSNFGSNG